jgi:hypothetical protein
MDAYNFEINMKNTGSGEKDWIEVTQNQVSEKDSMLTLLTFLV